MVLKIKKIIIFPLILLTKKTLTKYINFKQMNIESIIKIKTLLVYIIIKTILKNFMKEKEILFLQ